MASSTTGASPSSNKFGGIDDATVQFTTERFPIDAALKGKVGLPFGCVVRPFAPHEVAGLAAFEGVPVADDVARCSKCFAYINVFAKFELRDR